jgi:hypothetical protein
MQPRSPQPPTALLLHQRAHSNKRRPALLGTALPPRKSADTRTALMRKVYQIRVDGMQARWKRLELDAVEADAVAALPRGRVAA